MAPDPQGTTNPHGVASPSATTTLIDSGCRATVHTITTDHDTSSSSPSRGEKGSTTSGWPAGRPVFEDNLPKPSLQHPSDIVVKVHKTTICGTDLHLLRGAVATCKPSVRLGHEGIGVITEKGLGVTKFDIGDRVLVSCITRCDECEFCRRRLYGQCLDGGWQLGHTIDGMQGDFCRVPHADFSCFKIPERFWDTACEDELVLCSDILPTGLEVGLLECPALGLKPVEDAPWLRSELPPAGGKAQSGTPADKLSLALIGCGPVGSAALQTAMTFFPHRFGGIFLVDLSEHRLSVAEHIVQTGFLASTAVSKSPPPNIPVRQILNTNGDAASQILHLTNGSGCDVVLEAIGLPAGWALCQDCVKPGGHISILGVHGAPATFNLERLWYRNFTLSAGMVHGFSIPDLMRQIMERWDEDQTMVSKPPEATVGVGAAADDRRYGRVADVVVAAADDRRYGRVADVVVAAADDRRYGRVADVAGYPRLISHRMPLGEVETAYVMFRDAGEHEAMKILLHNA